MPNTRSAKKRLRQNAKRRLRNRSRGARMRTAIRSFGKTVQEGDVEAAPEKLKEAISLVDRAVKQGLIHRNNAARRKSRLMRRLNAATATSETESAAVGE